MGKIQAFFITLVVFAPIIAFYIWYFVARKCPKCGGLSWGRASALNTSGRDQHFRCTKCNYEWYSDRSNKFF